ncbi:MAG: NAD(P)H-dependent oxidoreductase [Thermoanaerobaculia bacterium]
MIIVDRLLEQRAAEGRPVRVGMLGCGFMGQGIVNQVVNSATGMEMAVVFNRDPERARRAFETAGISEVVNASSPQEVRSAIERGVPAVTDDPSLVTTSEGVDAVVEVTGTIDFAATWILSAIDHGKHVVLMNAEIDGTVGPILKHYADRAGVVLTASEGDQPGVQMNLYRFVRGIGVEPLVCGNVKGLHDPYRNPTTQQGFAERWGQNVYMVTSFADGTKISFEQAIVANATGMTVARRGMLGADHGGHVDELTAAYDVDELRELGGIVDYVVGARPSPGVFVLGAHDDPKQQHYLNLYKLGEGPLYSFNIPYHLCHFEVPSSVGRAVLLGDAVMTPLAGPQVEVVATAKRDLEAGETLDALGGYTMYGLAETAAITADEHLLPIGVAEGCVLKRRIEKDTVLTYDDVEVPEGRLVDRLRHEQDERFGVPAHRTRTVSVIGKVAEPAVAAARRLTGLLIEPMVDFVAGVAPQLG